MSTFGVRKRRKLGVLAALAAAFGAFLTLGAGNAAAFSCSVVNPATGADVLITMTNETVTISKGNLSAILVNGFGCGGATASNTETVFITVTNTGGPLTNLIIDEGGGRFEPGFPTGGVNVEAPGLNDIEFILIDADGITGGFADMVDSLTILGNSAPDTINIGDGAFFGNPDDFTGGAPVGDDALAPSDVGQEFGVINLNGDADAEIFIDLGQGNLNVLGVISVFGRGGNDVISGKGGGELGNAAYQFFAFGGLFIDGGDGDDSIQGSEGDDILVGGAGNDTIDGDSSSEEIDDGCDSQVAFMNFVTGQVDLFALPGDTISYAGSTGPVTVDLDPNEAHPGVGTGDGTDVLQNIENIIGSPANDTLSGDNNNNLILGGAGDDAIAGDAGDDCELGNDGNDTFNENEGSSLAQGGFGALGNGSDVIFGNAGLDDTIDYNTRTTRINVYLESLNGVTLGDLDDDCDSEDGNGFGLGGSTIFADGADLDGDGDSSDFFALAGEGDCVFQDTENVVTGSGNDLIVASFLNNSADNEFTGNGGNDFMDGGRGNDIFHEGTAANGSDDMDGGTGSDTCDFSGRTNGVSVALDGADNDGEAGEGDNCGGVVNLTPPGFDEGDPIAGPDVENVNGGSGNDTIVGDADANILNGNAGNDVINGADGSDVVNGGDGDDTLAGNAGNDAVSGGAGTDTAEFGSAGSGGVGVNVNLATGASSGEGNDTLADMENVNGSSFTDSLRGNSGNNVLNGRGGNDAIQGSDGDDTANGGAGNDVLGGGAGNDRADGGTGNDAVNGNAGDDNLQGGPGNDTLRGGADNDVLSGGAGKDDHRGGPGTDRCNPGSPGLAAGDRAVGCES